MFKVFRNAWHVKDLRQKMLFVLIILAVYRLGAHIPLPGMNMELVNSYKEQATQGTRTLYSLIAGGGFGTIFALGIGPYITASIIMQLLTVAIPKLEQLQKEGDEGRKKISAYTRYAAVIFAILQGGAMVFSLRSFLLYDTYLSYAVCIMSLVAGTIFIMWLGELINERGIGNGSSFIVFANIIAGLPSAINMFISIIQEDPAWGTVRVVLLLMLFIAIVAFVVLVQDGERRIPIHYAKGMGSKVGNTSYIPMKVNIAGVMSIIFAITLLQLPATINQIMNNAKVARVAEFFDMNTLTGAVAYIILIFVFTFFYTSFAVNPVEMSENLKKSSGNIPGVRPGKPTADYIQSTVDRLSWIGAAFYSIIAVTPILLQAIFNMNVGFGGTTLLIVTGVCLDLTKQLESQLLVREYKGFLK